MGDEVDEIKLDSSTDNVQSAADAERNAKELHAAKAGHPGPTVLGESDNDSVLPSTRNIQMPSSLGQMIHRAQVTLDSGEAEEAIDSASQSGVEPENVLHDATMLKLQDQLH